MPGFVSLFGQQPQGYSCHRTHDGGSIYGETNCYSDVIIELLHARGDEPLAVMGSTLRLDFEGDQWTFFKPAPADLETLFGIDIHEMQPYRPLPQQAVELIEGGETLIVEVDSFYLPDTEATSYRSSHVKSSIAVEAIDITSERLRYFHNAGLHELTGEDYRGVFREGRPFSDDVLPPYTEIVRFDERTRLTGEQLRQAMVPVLRSHLQQRPQTNPFPRFAAQLDAQLPALLEGDEQLYHDYTFATLRMAGAGFELAAMTAEWALGDDGVAACEPLREIVTLSKTLSFRLARRRPLDTGPATTQMAECWQQSMARLDELLV